MSDEQIRQLIREVLAEQTRQHGYAKRDPLVAFSDPDGKSWYSATVSRLQALSLLLTLLGMIGGVVWGAMATRDAVVVFPEVAAQIERHDVAAAARLAKEYATKSELAAVAAEARVVTRGRDEQIAALKESIAELRDQNERIDAKLDRLLARGR
ncbi:MAG TPA: hypothetical protein P5199_13320 [Thermoanaerobaculia bacterium]|nr:hypothetical protein [Thermoanaerobaculia bacterium]